MSEELSIAEQLHHAYKVIDRVESVILDAFEEHEPEVYLDFSIGSDSYDNSIEIYIKNVLPYPYEPCKAIRKAIYDLGFSIVYWNFIDEQGNYSEEIRGSEPRRLKNAPHLYTKYGYVDARFNEELYLKTLPPTL